MSKVKNQDPRNPNARPGAPDKGHEPPRAQSEHAGQQHARSDQHPRQPGSTGSPGQHGAGSNAASGQQHAADMSRPGQPRQQGHDQDRQRHEERPGEHQGSRSDDR